MGEVVLFSISRSAFANSECFFRKSFPPCLEQTEAEVGPGERLLANGVVVHIVLQVAIRQQWPMRLRRMTFLSRTNSKRSNLQDVDGRSRIGGGFAWK
jgi:hypothetical protein